MFEKVEELDEKHAPQISKKYKEGEKTHGFWVLLSVAFENKCAYGVQV
jgi:hypothetical protein